jgi:hypothetical protein
MMDNVFLKPARDADGKAMLVPDEVTHRPLKEEGEWKPRTMYWERRIRDLDVIPSEPPKEATKEAVKEVAAAPIPSPAKASPSKSPKPDDFRGDDAA